MFQAVIFDMDGLLIDSEPLWMQAEIDVFADVGIALDEEACARTRGLRTDDVVDYWFQRRPWTSATPGEIELRLIERVCQLVRADGRALRGAREAVARARASGRRPALASSSPMPIIQATLARLGLEATFDVVHSAEHEPFGKPHPAVFLSTAQKLDVRATRCLVLEDSMTGVVAAKAARMGCVAVPLGYPGHDARFVLADAVVGSLDDVTPSLIARLERALDVTG